MNTQGETEWLSVPEVGELLDIPLRDVRDMIRAHDLVATRRAETNAVIVHREELIERDGRWIVLPSLRGTVTVLEDAGLKDDEALEWLLGENSLLHARPIDVLREGNVHAVRRAAGIQAI